VAVSGAGVPAGRGTLDLKTLVAALEAAGVRYVVTGSVAAAAWMGAAETPPGDLDIVPELSRENLSRLAAFLGQCQARPVHRPDWKRTLSPEECARWRPQPATAQQLDHQLETPWGLLDVVPEISGAFAHLVLRAAPADAWGIEVRIAHPEDLIATLRPDREEKHRRRQAGLAAARARAAAGARPAGLASLFLGLSG